MNYVIERLGQSPRSRNIVMACLAPFSVLTLAPATVYAQSETAAEELIEEIVVIGSRKPGRSAAESMVPIDVISGEDFGLIGNSAWPPIKHWSW